MKVTVLRPDALTAQQRNAWTELVAREPMLRSPYFQPSYHELVAGVRDDVFVAVVEDGEAPVAFLPFQRSRFGFGRPVGGPLSDYHGLIAARDAQLDVRAILRGAGLTSWEFDHLPADQSWFADWTTHAEESPVVEISESLEAWLACRKAAGSKIGEQTMRRWRKAQRELGEIRFVAHVVDREVFDQVCAWKSEQYIRTEKVDVLSFSWTRDLLWQIVNHQEANFAGTLSALYCGDRLVAGHIGMRSTRVWHWWFPSYDVEQSAYSPGTLLLLEMIRSAAELGMDEIDLGKGAATYKDRFRTTTVPLTEGRVVVPSLVQTLHAGAQRTWQGVRGLPLPGFLRAPGRLLRRLARRGALR